VKERFQLVGKHGVEHIALWAVGGLQSPGAPNITGLEAAWRPWLPHLRSFLAGNHQSSHRPRKAAAETAAKTSGAR
jgi:hypothetical protein